MTQSILTLLAVVLAIGYIVKSTILPLFKKNKSCNSGACGCVDLKKKQ